MYSLCFKCLTVVRYSARYWGMMKSKTKCVLCAPGNFNLLRVHTGNPVSLINELMNWTLEH